MVFSKLLFKKEKRKEEEEEAPPPDVRGFTVAEIWELKLRLHEATRDLDQQAICRSPSRKPHPCAISANLEPVASYRPGRETSASLEHPESQSGSKVGHTPSSTLTDVNPNHQAWTQRFHLADRRSEGALSFDDFRRTVRSANVKASVISDVDLKVVENENDQR